jgi:large subunit ribosomal protein L49
VPVYLEILQNGTTRRSVVKHIEGDIWALDEEIRKLITKKTGKRSYSRINEMNRKIVFKGDYVTLIQKYLISKGL